MLAAQLRRAQNGLLHPLVGAGRQQSTSPVPRDRQQATSPVPRSLAGRSLSARAGGGRAPSKQETQLPALSARQSDRGALKGRSALESKADAAAVRKAALAAEGDGERRTFNGVPASRAVPEPGDSNRPVERHTDHGARRPEKADRAVSSQGSRRGQSIMGAMTGKKRPGLSVESLCGDWEPAGERWASWKIDEEGRLFHKGRFAGEVAVDEAGAICRGEWRLVAQLSSESRLTWKKPGEGTVSGTVVWTRAGRRQPDVIASNSLSQTFSMESMFSNATEISCSPKMGKMLRGQDPLLAPSPWPEEQVSGSQTMASAVLWRKSDARPGPRGDATSRSGKRKVSLQTATRRERVDGPAEESMLSPQSSVESMLTARASVENIVDCEPFAEGPTAGSCNGARITTEELHTDLLGLLGESRAAALAKQASERRRTANDRKSSCSSVWERDDENEFMESAKEGEDGDLTARSKWVRVRGNLRRLKGKEADVGADAGAMIADIVAAAKIQKKEEEKKKKEEKPPEDSGLKGLGRFLPTTLPERKHKENHLSPGSQSHTGGSGSSSFQMSASRHFEAQTESVAQRVKHLRRMSAGFSLFDKEDRKAWRKKKCINADVAFSDDSADDSSDDDSSSGLSLPSDDEDEVQPIRLLIETK